MLMTDRFRLLFSTLASNSDWRLDTPWTSGSLVLLRQHQPTPPAHLALPHHRSGISKSPVPQRGQLHFMSRIANGLYMVKSLVRTFLFLKLVYRYIAKRGSSYCLFILVMNAIRLWHATKNRCLFLCLIYIH